MQLSFLGKDSEGGESPTLYVTDQDSYIVQGYVVTDDEILAKLDIPDGETVVEVYARLFMASGQGRRDRHGDVLGTAHRPRQGQRQLHRPRRTS
jgi:hypothetical protein